MQGIFRKFVVSMAVLGTLLFALGVALDNPYADKLLRAAIDEKLREHTRISLRAKALGLSILPPGVEVEGLEVSSTDVPGVPLLTASSLKLRVSLWSLFLGEFKLSKVEAVGPTLVWPPPLGFKGWLKDEPIGPPEPEADEPWRWPPDFELPVQDVIIKNGRLYAEFEDFDGPPQVGSWINISTVGFDLDVEFYGFRAAEGDFVLRGLEFDYAGASLVEKGELSGELALTGSNFKVEDLKLDAERLKLNGQLTGDIATVGKHKIIDGIRFAINGAIDGDLGVLGSFLDLETTRGNVKGDARVAVAIPVGESSTIGKTYDFLIEGQGEVMDGWFAGFRLFDSKTKFKLTPREVRFDDLDVRLAGQSYGSGEGVLHFDEVLAFDFKVRPRGLHLQDLLSSVGVGFDLIDVQMDSEDLRIYGQGFPLDLNATGTVQLTNISLPTIPYDHSAFPQSPACRLDYHMRVTEKDMSIDGTHGFCFNAKVAEGLPAPAKGELAPPDQAKAVSPLSAAGKIHFDAQKGLNLKVSSDQFDLGLSEYFAQVPMQGTGPMHAAIYGPFDRVEIASKLALAEVKVMGVPLGKVQAETLVLGTKVTLKDLTIEPPGGGRLHSKKGSLEANDILDFQLQVAADDVDPSWLESVLEGQGQDLPLAFGIRRLRADLKGSLYTPLAWMGQVEGVFNALRYDGEKLLDELTMTATLGPKRLATQNLTASIGTLKLGGEMVLDRPSVVDPLKVINAEDTLVRLGWQDQAVLSANFRADKAQASEGNDEDHLASLPYVGAMLKAADIKGLVQLEGKLTASKQGVQGTYSGALEDLSIRGAKMPPLLLKGFVNDAKIDTLVSHLGNVMTGRMSVDVMQKGMPYEWYFDFNRLDLRAFGSAFFYQDPRNFAYLSANWQMKGLLLDWWRSEGALNVKDIQIKYVRDVAAQTKSLNLRQTKPVKVQFGQSGWRLSEGDEWLLEGSQLAVRLSLPDCRPPANLSLGLDADIDLGLARDFSTAIDTASGRLRATAEVLGPVENPDLVVEVKDQKPDPLDPKALPPVSIGFVDARPALRNVDVRVFYSGGRLIIDRLSADKGTGQVAASGTINLDPSLPDDSHLDIQFNDATLIVSVAVLKSFEMQLSGKLALTGSHLPYKLTGDIQIDKARSTKEVDIRDEIINALRRQSFTVEAEAKEPVLELDLAVSSDKSINIHNRNIQSILSTDLKVKGSDQKPSITGKVDVDKGRFTYKQDFRVERGIITFDDPVRPDPNLDILAVSEVDAYRVYIAITGRASNPTVEFAIDPPTRENGSPISKMEILVLLTRGTLPEANRSIGETQNAATSEALNLIVGQFEEPVEKLFDLSGQNIVRNVYFDTYPSSDPASEGKPVPRVNLPLDLGENFDVVVRTDQYTDEAAAEYSVHENINFSAIYGRRRNESSKDAATNTPQGDTKLNLKFRFAFE